MIRRTFLLFITLATATGCATVSTQAPNSLTAREQAEGWILLFDGKSVDGWHNFASAGVKPQWTVNGDSLTLTGEGGDDIVTDGDYDNFELLIDWNISKGGNSGIFYHVVDAGRAAFLSGPEYQILDNRNATEPPIEQAASLFALYPPSHDASSPSGTYNRTRLVVNHGKVEHWLNGQKVLAYDLNSEDFARRVAASKFSTKGPYGQAVAGFARAGKGKIALQDHGNPIRFRNIKIRRLK